MIPGTDQIRIGWGHRVFLASLSITIIQVLGGYSTYFLTVLGKQLIFIFHQSSESYWGTDEHASVSFAGYLEHKTETAW